MTAADIVWDPSLPETSGSIAVGFSTCKEIQDEITLQVAGPGQIPPYVSGRLYRNGSGLYELGPHKNGEITHINHWFDGVGVMHRFHIDSTGGVVKYKNRRLFPGIEQAAKQAPSRAAFKFRAFGNQDPCRGVLGHLFSAWKPFKREKTPPVPSNINVTLESIPGLGGFLSRTDFNESAVLDIDTLEPAKIHSFSQLDPSLSGGATAAHGVTDPETGSYINYAFEYGPNPLYSVFETSLDGKTRILATFKDKPAYIHSMAATRNYAILMIYSVTMDMLKLLINGNSLLNGLKYQNDLRPKFYVISRGDDPKVEAVYDTEPFFCFHQINAFEQDRDILIDLVRYKNGDVLTLLYRKQILNNLDAVPDDSDPVRFTLANIDAAKDAYKDDGKAVAVAKFVPLVPDAEIDIELPTIDGDRGMQNYKYAYGISSSGDGRQLWGSIVKIDVTGQGKPVYYSPESGACGEAIFVKNPSSTREDDGTLLTVVLDTKEEKSYLAFIDATSMQEICRAIVPQAVPFGFHGKYMSEQQAASLK